MIYFIFYPSSHLHIEKFIIVLVISNFKRFLQILNNFPAFLVNEGNDLVCAGEEALNTSS